MANELRHSDVGTALSKTEWEAVGSHVLNSQAAGDLIYASSTSQLSRLAIGSANQFLVSTGSAPSWTSSPAVVTAITPDASDGATLGTAALEWSDLYMADGAVIYFGDDDDVTLTHVHNDGLLLSSTDQLQFGDSGTYIYQSTDGQLDLVADTEIQIAATTIDINGAVALNGAITGATNITLSGELDAATLDLSSSADIAGDLVLSGGADGALQFTNAGENSIKIPDNQASALIIEEANNAYITFVTSNSSEAITVAKATTFSAGITNAGTIAAGTWNGTAIATAYIADDAITSAKIADDAVVSAAIADDAITSALIADDAIITALIADDAITTALIADDAITSALIADDAVVTAAIADDAITSALIADDAVGSAAIADNAITNALMADDAIDSAEIADGAVDLAHMSSESVDEDNLYISNSGSNGQFLSKQSGNNGGLTWATPTDTNTTYTAGDGLTLTGTDFDLDAALTTVSSLLRTDIKIGEDDQTKVDFETADEIHFYAANVHQVKLVDNAFTPQADSDVDLGASGTYWKDAFIDKITTTGDIELGHASDTTLARSASGTVTIEGDVITTAGVMDMWIPAGAMRAASTNGCADITDVETTATRPDMQVLDFDSSTQEYAQFSIAMPKSWNEGTVTAQFYWTHATAVSTDVIWGIQGVCVSDNDTIDIAYGTAQTVTDTFHNAAEDLAISAATSAITLAGSPAVGDLAFFQVYRDADAAGDTTNSTDARLVGVKLMFTTNAANDA